MDPYLALIRGTPQGKTRAEQAQQEVLANTLRRTRNFGALGMGSGDEFLAPLGKRMYDSAGEQAKTLGSNRMAQQRQDDLRGYYDTQRKQMEQGIDAANKKHELAKAKQALEERKADDLARYRDRMARAALKRAMAAADKAKNNPYKRLTSSASGKLMARGEVMDTLDSLLNEFESDPKFDPGRAAIPFQRTASNFLAQYGFGTDNSKDIQDWWALYNKFYTLPERNEKFGATLTPNEQAAWRDANIGPEMTTAQIKEKLGNLQKVMASWTQRMMKGYRADSHNPEAIEEFVGREFDDSGDSILVEPETLPDGYTEDDIKFSMKMFGMTRDEVIRELKGGN